MSDSRGTMTAALLCAAAVMTPLGAYEVVAVDDCSRDATRARLRDATTLGPVRVLAHAVNRGQSAAICTGIDSQKPLTRSRSRPPPARSRCCCPAPAHRTAPGRSRCRLPPEGGFECSQHRRKNLIFLRPYRVQLAAHPFRQQASVERVQAGFIELHLGRRHRQAREFG